MTFITAKTWMKIGISYSRKNCKPPSVSSYCLAQIIGGNFPINKKTIRQVLISYKKSKDFCSLAVKKEKPQL